MKTKYSNGKFISTSKPQDTLSNHTFAMLREAKVLKSMGMSFNQDTGDCTYSFAIIGESCELYMTVNRKGKVIERGWM